MGLHVLINKHCVTLKKKWEEKKSKTEIAVALLGQIGIFQSNFLILNCFSSIRFWTEKKFDLKLTVGLRGTIFVHIFETSLSIPVTVLYYLDGIFLFTQPV